MANLWTTVRSSLTWLLRAMIVAAILLCIGRAAALTSSLLSGQPALIEDSLGFDLSRDSAGRPGWRYVDRVAPDSVAAQAGLRPGDKVRYDGFDREMIMVQPGDHVSMCVERNHAQFPMTLIARPVGQHDSATQIGIVLGALNFFARLGFGLLLLVRGKGNRAATMLGLVFLAMLASSYGWWLPYWLAVPAIIVLWAVGSLFGYCWFSFAREISGGRASAWQGQLANWGGAFFAIMYLVAIVTGQLAIPVPIPSHAIFLIAAASSIGAGFLLMGINYRRNEPPARNRIKIIVAAFLLLLLGTILANLPQSGPKLPSIGDALSLCMIALLTYAVLKQRLFDLGFAINRTLVFGSISFSLLATFGLLEWGAERFVPEAWHEGGPFISAAIALGLFLSFHRMRDWIERHVERLFFSSWHRAEAALRRFVESAGHFDRMPKLCTSFAEAVSRYAQGAPAALYLREDGGAYRLATGGLAGAGASYADDDPAFALMRAERQPIELAQSNGSLPGALALPMLDQGTLTGFILLDGRPDGAQYRPDEIENLGWAALQVGLDLQALHARELEVEVASLRQKLALTEERDRLASILSKLSPQT